MSKCHPGHLFLRQWWRYRECFGAGTPQYFPEPPSALKDLRIYMHCLYSHNMLFFWSQFEGWGTLNFSHFGNLLHFGSIRSPHTIFFWLYRCSKALGIVMAFTSLEADYFAIMPKEIFIFFGRKRQSASLFHSVILERDCNKTGHIPSDSNM